jgi:Putative glucoamylase/Protein of unknown function (DUF3131)
MRHSVRTTVLATLVSATLVVGVSSGSTSADVEQEKTAAGVEQEKSSGDLLLKYAKDTWRSFEAMNVRRTGMPTDNVGGGLRPESRAKYTSPTNIGAYLWSTVAARDIGLIGRTEARRRMTKTLRSVARLERHEPSGMFYNWYAPRSLKKLTKWPVDGSVVKPFLSSVDNAWLATGLLIAGRAEPRLRPLAKRLRTSMDFGCYYNPAENGGGQIRGGFWDENPAEDAAVTGDYCAMGTDVWYTGHHYGALNTEPRMASYLGIASGQIPKRHYFGTFRTFPPSCDWDWTETMPTGRWRTYEGVRVFEGTLPHRGRKVVPTWGGSMFEALMVPLFVPEEKWGPRSWGRNHPLYVRGQIEHGLKETGYGYWGFSPSNDPAGGYREYGVDALGLDGPGYTSDQERTTNEQPYGDCRESQPAPTEYGDGVVTPHASFLALRYARKPALANLTKLARNFEAYGKGGFFDAVAVGSGQVSKRYLSLDQGMVMAALGNELGDEALRRYVAKGAMERRVRPLLRQEVFTTQDRP